MSEIILQSTVLLALFSKEKVLRVSCRALFTLALVLFMRTFPKHLLRKVPPVPYRISTSGLGFQCIYFRGTTFKPGLSISRLYVY